MEEAVFLDLYREIAPRLRSYLHIALGDRHLADDLLQEAFYRFLRAEPRDLNAFQARSYLYKTAATLIADQKRARVRERGYQDQTLVTASESPRLDLAIDMSRLFAQLPSQQQTLLWLAYVEGFSHREIASSLGLREKSVRVVLFRARKKMASIFEAHEWGASEA